MRWRRSAPGQSQELVVAVLGSPQTTNAFDEGSAWYYVQTKVSQTAFGLTTRVERTVLAIYFDKNKRVADKALYALKDGKVVHHRGPQDAGLWRGPDLHPVASSSRFGPRHGN